MKLKPHFERPIGEVVQRFTSARTVEEVCASLEIPKGNLLFIAYRNGGVAARYKLFEIQKKSGGTRTIMAPTGGLKIVHQKIDRILKFNPREKEWSHGGWPGKSIVTNASRHNKSNYILNVDIEDFYRSIHFGRVSGIFRNYLKFDKSAADFLAHLCCYEGALPPGSPCAMALADLAAWSLDQKMISIAKEYKLKYTRYVDDITLSTKLKYFPSAIGHYIEHGDESGPGRSGPTLEAKIAEAGFRLNPRKTRLQSKRNHQSVTGLTVNEFPNLRRKKVKEIRKLIYLWAKFGSDTASQYLFGATAKKEKFLQTVYGNVAFLKGVRGESDEIFRKFCYQICCITPNNPEWVKNGAKDFQVKDIFLSHASEDKELIAKPLYDACVAQGISVFYDSEDIEWGDSIIEKINKGLGEAKIFVPIITPIFLQKKWPIKELNTAFSRFVNDKTRILPILHEVGDLTQYPLMTDILYKKWENGDQFPNDVAKILFGRISSMNP